MKSKKLWLVVMSSLLSLFAGCGGGGGGSSSGGSTGTISMSMTDAKPVLPGHVANCFVTIDEVLVHKSGGGWETLRMVQTPYTIDLLQFRDGSTTEFVPPVALASGKYTQIRLSVIKAVLRFDDGVTTEDVTVTIPSGNLKTDKNFDFDVAGSAAVDITVDFDLSKSIVVEGPAGTPSYKLKPVLHIVETAEAATIEGTIANTKFVGNYVVIRVLDSFGEEYTKVQIDINKAAVDGKTAYSIFWLVPNQAYTVEISYDPLLDDDPVTDGIQYHYDESVDVPTVPDANYPQGTLEPGDNYPLSFPHTP